MKKEKALRSILIVWQRLSAEERQTEAQLVIFAMQMANDSEYWFQSEDDRYQVIMGFLSRNTSGLEKQGV